MIAKSLMHKTDIVVHTLYSVGIHSALRFGLLFYDIELKYMNATFSRDYDQENIQTIIEIYNICFHSLLTAIYLNNGDSASS